ncbi:hypothetical protein A2U01_0058596 [Trifolium medium]|uniref:Uncharacterized protein n=1 Tax=Trifolium medium TaxID=97028 RepID=A0A392RME1_9FABA|nr:hypothetical protein [Trifolium medium]
MSIALLPPTWLYNSGSTFTPISVAICRRGGARARPRPSPSLV